MAQRCTAKAKSTGVQCARYAIEGASTCRVHGSGSKKAKAAAARRVAEAKAAEAAERAVTTLGLSRDVSPSEALLEEVRWTAGHVDWLRDRVREVERDELVWGKTKEKSGSLDPDGLPAAEVTESATPSVWYDLYERERRHLVAVCTAALRAGVEERRVALAESQGALVGQAFGRILDGMYDALIAAGMASDLRDAWAAATTLIVPRELRALASRTTA